MRIFANFTEACKEVERELKHNGIVYQSDTVQDQVVEGNENFKTKELLGYSFIVKAPGVSDFIKEYGLNEDWILAEFGERIGRMQVNPGEAYKLRSVWEQFLHNGRFSYTYSDRIGNQVQDVIELLTRKPHSRHGIITVYQTNIDNFRRDTNERVPCTMYYNVFIRPDGEGNDVVHMIYNIRSNDFAEHFKYDIVLARMLQEYIAAKLGKPIGDFIYQSGSLHVFAKDSAEIF